MKKLLVIFVIMSAVITLFAQSPGKLSYQAVIRNIQDKLVTSHAIGMRVTILKGSVSGTAVYHETHHANTNANGLLTLEIGSGISSEDFSAIDWSKGPYFIMTETDPEGGTNYTITGISQLLSVPYALYAQTAGNLAGPVNETDPVFKASQAARITSGDITKLGNLSGVNTGDQDISAMTHNNRTALNAVTGINTGDQDLSGLATTTAVTTGLATKVDKVAGKGLSSEDYTTADKTKVSNLSGVNTGDQDISAMIHNNRSFLNAVTGINTGDQDLSGLATTTSVTTGLASKVDKLAGKGLSTEDYTTAEKTKLSGVAAGAEVNVQADWNQATNTADDYIKNKPTIPSQYTDAMADVRVAAGITNKVDKVAGKGLSTEDYTTPEKTKLAAITGTNSGDQDLSGLATKTEVTTGLATKVDKVAGKGLSTNDYTTPEKTKLAAITGTNTGDQDLSGLATKIEVTSGLDTKVTKVAGKGLSTEDYTTPEKAKLAAITGTNTGDQDLSGLATTTALTTGLNLKVDKIAGKGLSTEDYTTAEKTKVTNLSGVNTGDQDISAMTHTNRTALDAVSGVNTGDQDLSGLATTTSVTTGLATKVDKVAGKGLSTEDYTTPEKTKLAAITGTNTGDQDLSGLATTSEVISGLATKVDKVAGKGLSTEDYTTAEKTKVSNLSGVNTGDQDIAAMTHTNRTALDAVSGTNTGDQDLSGLATKTDVTTGLAAKVDKVAGKGLSTEDYTTPEKAKLAAITGTNTGDQDLSGLATTTSVTVGLSAKVDKVTGKGLSTEDYTTAEKTKVSNLSGVNTGDQDIAAMTHTNRTALDAVSGINTGDQDLSGLATKTEVTTGLATKVDKVAGKGLSTEDYTTPEKTKLAAITGTNTGDQDLSGLATTTSVTTGLAAKVDKVAGKGLSSEDYSTAEKSKLAGIASGAEANVQADWNQTTNTADDYIKNKPAIPSQYTDAMADIRVAAGITNKVDKVAGKGLSTEDYSTPEKAKLAAITGTNTGDQDLSGLATRIEVTSGLDTKVTKVAGKGLSTEDYTTPEKAKLAAITGINTGDQDLSGLATTTSVTTGLATKVDKIAGKGLSTEDYTTAEKTKVSNLSGVNTGDQDISAMTHYNRLALDAVSGINTGDQDLSGLATKTEVTTGLGAKVDKIAGKGLSTEDYTTAEKTKVSNLSGVNTGDQDISAMTHTNRTAIDAVTGINTGDQDLSGLATKIEVTSGLDTKVTKVAGKGLSTEDYTTPEKAKLAAITGTNTGDQDLSGLATTTSVTTGLSTKVDKVAGKGLSTEDYTTAEKTKVSNLSGVNTGDQDIAAMTHTNRTALDAVTGINTGDQDLSGLATKIEVTSGLDTKVTKVAGKGLSTEDYTTVEKTKVSNLSGVNTGDQDLSGLATKIEVTSGLDTKVTKVAGKGLSTEDYTTVEKTKVSNLSGVNTGDQDISAMTHTNRTALDAVSGINTGDQDLSGLATTSSVTSGLATKVDKVAGKGLSTEDYTTAEKSKVSNLSGVNTGDQDIAAMTHTNRTALDAVLGINTGDQDLSGLATKMALKDSTATVRSLIPDVSHFLISETDPVFSASAAEGITSANITNWNAAFGWGNHAGLYRPIDWVPAWTEVIGKPFRIDLPKNGDLLMYDQGIEHWINWTPNYLTSFTETDPQWTTESTNYYTKANMLTSGQSQLHFNNLIDKPTTLTGYGILDAGLVNFAESNYLYNSKYGVKLQAKNDAQTNVDFVLSPKGFGAILLQQPDGTANVGGNNRGSFAIDLQRARSTNTQVASGASSVILGGGFNTASGHMSTVIGNNSVASGNWSIALGNQATASALYTFATGQASVASGNYSTVIGADTKASGAFSTAIGYGVNASGDASTAMGYYTTAPSGYEVVTGRYNTNYIPSSTTEWNSTDRLFVVGNGTAEGSPSNALMILKNANTTIGGSLTINGNGMNYSFPTGRGTSGQVLKTNADGTTSWAAVGLAAESDPVFQVSPAAGITTTNTSNWNEAYSWGNHAGLYRPLSYVPAWSEITGNPFSISSPANNQLLKYNSTSSKWENWTPNFLTSFTETDPVWTTASSNYYTKTNMQTSGSAQLNFNNLTNNPTTLSGYGITDALSTSHPANSISSTNIQSWNDGIWSRSGSNLYYSGGKVGIGTSDPSGLLVSPFNVEGGIRYSGSPSPAPGLLYYDPSGSGTFRYFDNTSTSQVLGTGTITYSGGLWTSVSSDLVSNADVMVNSRLGVGAGVQPGTDFGFATILLRDNNLRIKFDDNSGQGFTNNDWQLTANDNVSGGSNYFALEDLTASKVPFKVMAGAPTNSLFVDASGNVGLGTNTPARKLHVSDVMRLQPTTEPANPGAGDLYFDSGTNTLRCYDGTTWHNLW